MSEYACFFSCTIFHEYFAGGRCHVLDFVPTDSCLEIMQSAGLLLRPSPGGITALADCKKADVLRMMSEDTDDPFVLRFKVFSRDEYFVSYSEPEMRPSSRMGVCPVPVLQGAFDSSDDGIMCLHKEAFVNESDKTDITPLIMNNEVSDRELCDGLCMIVEFHISKQHVERFIEHGLGVDTKICFDNKKLFWKYLVIRSNPELLCEDDVLDNTGSVQFIYQGREHSGDYLVDVFQSDQKLPVSERSQYIFQLKRNNKTIVQRLPVASSRSITGDVIYGNKELYAEIVVV